MSIFGWGDQTKSAGEGIEKAAEGIGSALDKVFTSDEERLNHEQIMERIRSQPKTIMGALAIIDAKSRNIFQAGWRPFIGWVAGIALFLYFVPQFSLGAYIYVNEYIEHGKLIDYPVDPKAMFELVCALLGLGGLRTLEKLNGAAK